MYINTRGHKIRDLRIKYLRYWESFNNEKVFSFYPKIMDSGYIKFFLSNHFVSKIFNAVILKTKLKGMTFDHDFGYSSPKKRGKKKRRMN